MSDFPISALNPLAEANPLLSDQILIQPWGPDNWKGGLGSFGGGLVGNSFSPVSINIYNPSISLRVEQFAFAEQYQQWNFTIVSLRDNIRHLTTEIEELREEIRQLCRTRTFVVPLTTLSPAPFQITKQIPLTIEGDGDDFTATFTEANISASGETEADAIANFKDSLVSTYAFLESLPETERGPLPARQWEVLRSALTR
jgi:hypothetical protein